MVGLQGSTTRAAASPLARGLGWFTFRGLRSPARIGLEFPLGVLPKPAQSLVEVGTHRLARRLITLRLVRPAARIIIFLPTVRMSGARAPIRRAVAPHSLAIQGKAAK
jgi:hypothetical protein